jgi:AcrR family transcriptional regulator
MPPRPDVSAERRAQIIEAALACFTRKGYNNTTMDDIVAESGLSKGSLYWYFESKDDLFAAAILSILENVGLEAVDALERRETASDKLRAVGQTAVSIGTTIEGFLAMFLEFWASSPNREKAGQLWFGVLEQYKDVVVGIIEEGIRDGEFKPVDPEPLVWAVMAAYDGLAAYVALWPDLDLDRISQVFVETLLSGLSSRQGDRQAEQREG